MKAGANRPKKKNQQQNLQEINQNQQEKKLIKKTSNQTKNCKKISKDSGENSSKTTICSILGTRYQSNSGCNNGHKKKRVANQN